VGSIVSREYEILYALKDTENIVQMLDFFYSHDSKKRLIQNTVLEFCDSSLEDIITASINQPITMPEIKYLMK
jgi:glycogen synthase kinase 3 beta